MPTFDIVSRMNFAELENALNNTQKAVAQRFDFRGCTADITLDKKDKKLRVLTEDNTKLANLREMFISAANRRGLELSAFEWGEGEPGAAGKVKCEVKIKDGLEQEKAKEIVKTIKETGLKVQASIQGEEVRVTGKKIDDLQAVIAALKGTDVGVPLQFVNMKS